MRFGWWLSAVAALALALSIAPGCEQPEPRQRLDGQVRVTFLHTSDIHSRLFPYNLQLGEIDAKLGLGSTGTIANVGGIARMSHIIGRERARADRVLHIDGGDCFQGAPVFNYFAGEAEIRALSAMGADAMLVANHEFDKGALNLGIQLQNWATFPVLVANYMLEDPAQPGASPLGTVVQPYSIFDLDGMQVAVIGMGNLSSLTSIYDMPNRLGITPLKTSEVAQFYVDLLRPLVDLVVVVSHLGLEFDQQMIEQTTGIDIVLGGHNHIVLQPPKRVQDCARVDEAGNHFIELASPEDQDPDAPPAKVRRICEPRQVVLSHSGAFAKFVGRLDVMVSNDPADFEPGFLYDPLNGFEVVSYDYELFTVTEKVPQDPVVASVLEPYGQGLDVLTNLELLVGYAPDGARRFSPNGGDSPLGNMIATAMWLRLGVQTDFSMTNTTGIRADVVPGPLTVEQLFNIFPFDNSITKMQLSGVEVQELFDFIARRSSGRGCSSQAQIAGARVVLDCVDQPDPELSPGKATHIYIGPLVPAASCDSDADCPGASFGSCDLSSNRCWQPLDPIASYELATSNYLAGGGSGFRVLQRNTTQFDTKIQQRDALLDYIRGGPACGSDEAGELISCRTDGDCVGRLGDGYACACPETTVEGEQCASDPSRPCALSDGTPGLGQGACVFARCRDDVAEYHRSICDGALTEADRTACLEALPPCATAGETCKFLACVDARVSNTVDGRVRMVGN
ncbi:MAG: bifunctional metallophosphatase/5'-nucleotidase [Deltaproteobacteria bacterium]|jgi:5'-nucleotidase|nr:bifunctional metallophosphatase/5'-nucleotidase [Deltaproteobacteria bacterium]MBW2531042.1 bifunctional metallophosphatase/5'-nucleotidase [Deltaproteobacteria bacterium]